jgi:restriction system protein
MGALYLAANHPGIAAAAAVALVVVAIALRWGKFHRRRANASTLGELMALSPAQFEDAVARLLRGLGYRDMRRVGGAGDLGADLVGRDPKGRAVVVQCKRYSPQVRVGTPAIQPLHSTMAIYRAERAVFVTTSAFTAPAVALAGRHGIDLIDGATLMRLLARR